MGDFFKSTRFKIIVLIFFLLLGFIAAAARYGILENISSQVADTLTSPFKEASTFVSGKVSGLFERFARSSVYYDEYLVQLDTITQLKEKVRELEEENRKLERYKELIEMSESDDLREYLSAVVIGRDPTDPYHSFTINKGSLDGINRGDTVITEGGLVGYVFSTTNRSALVQTILNPETIVGAFSSTTKSVGMVKGSLEMAQNGLTLMDSIPSESTMTVDEEIVTRGGDSPYPSQIIIGTVKSVEKKSTGTSKEAVLQPSVDVSRVKDVFIITNFRGKALGPDTIEGNSSSTEDNSSSSEDSTSSVEDSSGSQSSEGSSEQGR